MRVTDVADRALDTSPEDPGTPPQSLGSAGWGRWAWRQLTSMRTALLLLLLLAVLAVPGSVFPQRRVDRAAVADFARRHEDAYPWLERLWAFDVYASPWFSATYLLLFLSLLGCVVPRMRQHWRAMRARPPAPPRRLERLPEHVTATVSETPAAVAERAAAVLRAERYRVAVPAPGEVAAEKGHLRETGNLLFHASLLVILVAMAIGSMRGFTGNVVVVERGFFVSTRASYDTLRTGTHFDERDLIPFSVQLDRFRVRYEEGPSQFGAPREFTAEVRWQGSEGRGRAVVAPNQPLTIDGARVFVTGNGYAPHFTVRDRSGEVVYEGATPFLPRDGMNTSTGVVKVADAQPEPLGFEGFFLPTAAFDPERGPISIFPDSRLPRVVLTAWQGDLADDGRAQSVFTLDTSRMTQLERNGTPLRASLAPGETMKLPGGLGSITFDRVSRFVNFQVAHDPGRRLALLGALLVLGGLLPSLLVRRRRLWVRATPGADGRTVIEVAGLSRTEDDRLGDDVRRVAARVCGDDDPSRQRE